MISPAFQPPLSLPVPLRAASFSRRLSLSRRALSPRPAPRARAPVARAAPEARAQKVIAGPFAGHFGAWTLTQADVDGVVAYRAALGVSAAASAAGVALYAAVGDAGLREYARVFDGIYGVGALGFGAALQLIHIYMKPAHDALKVLFGVGVAGAVAVGLAVAGGGGGGDGMGLVEAVVARPGLMLAVGWQFVALTGLFFKEAVCFGRSEAIVAGVLVPVLSGGHFLGVLGGGVEKAGCVVFAAFFALFAARKFAQDAKDDLGDKSVFDHIAKGGSL